MLNRSLWNAIQFLSAQIGKAPLNCHCHHCEPGQTFLCEGCKREQPYCWGQDDDYLEFCDNCWAALPAVNAEQTTENQGN